MSAMYTANKTKNRFKTLACNSLRMTCKANRSENALSRVCMPPGGSSTSCARLRGCTACSTAPAQQRSAHSTQERSVFRLECNGGPAHLDLDLDLDLGPRRRRPHRRCEYVRRRCRAAARREMAAGATAARCCCPQPADTHGKRYKGCGGWRGGTGMHLDEVAGAGGAHVGG